MPSKRRITEPEKKTVAARQLWKCSACGKILEATYQVDHTVALMNGGRDHHSNMTAMCVRCHAKKTQREHMERAAPPADVLDDREDRVVGDGRLYQCSACKLLRPVHSSWSSHRCPGPGISRDVRAELSQYAYTPACSNGKPK